MPTIHDELVDIVLEQLERLVEGAEARLLFYGPPVSLLEPTFQALMSSGRVPSWLPILLVRSDIGEGGSNPAIGASGPCSVSHLLSIRNTPSASSVSSSFLALLPPGIQNIRSISSTADEFGIKASSNSLSVPFGLWWTDPFVQRLARAGLDHLGIAGQSVVEGLKLLGNAVDAAMSDAPASKKLQIAWDILARLFATDLTAEELDPAERLSRICGVPPLGDSRILFSVQTQMLKRIGDALANGYGGGFERLVEAAEPGDREALQQLEKHLRRTVPVVADFVSRPEVYYSPSDNDVEYWWQKLTVDKWSELLAVVAPDVQKIQLSCINGIITRDTDGVVIVEDGVRLAVPDSMVGVAEKPIVVNRRPKLSDREGLQGDAQDVGQYVDVDLPDHSRPISYSINSEPFKSNTVKVVSIASWAPGALVVCKSARKSTDPRKREGTVDGTSTWNMSLTVAGEGSHDILVFTTVGVEKLSIILGSESFQALETTSDYQLVSSRAFRGTIDSAVPVKLAFERRNAHGLLERTILDVEIAVDEVDIRGCQSELESLIGRNRTRSSQKNHMRWIVQPQRNLRIAILQDWMLAPTNSRVSFQPSVITEGYQDAWVNPTWGVGRGPVFSPGTLVHDPRPHFEGLKAPEGFLEAREAVAAEIRGNQAEGDLIESVALGEKMSLDEEFRELLGNYLDEYHGWLLESPDLARWCDLVLVSSLQQHEVSLAPYALLVSPLHPVRLAWQAVAQRALFEALDHGKRCPAASVLDPSTMIDSLDLPLLAPEGVRATKFISVESSSDYWSVLWNANALTTMPELASRAPFDSEFGLTIGGITSGFSSTQVEKAIDDTREMRGAKAILNVTVEGASNRSEAANEGLIEWARTNLAGGDSYSVGGRVGPALLNIFDLREPIARPDDAVVANLADEVLDRVKWFDNQPNHVTPDLAIVTQLDIAEPTVVDNGVRSPLGLQGLLRHRVRQQVGGNFVSETRSSMQVAAADGLGLERLPAVISMLESRGQGATSYQFAPRTQIISRLLTHHRADYVAVSSASIDPSCFMGDKVTGGFLWDYDMPNYSHRAGESSGYYLLSRIKQSDLEALEKSFRRVLPGGEMADQELEADLLEISRRGIPTLRGIASANSHATGDLGMFVASRLLQDSFRAGGEENGLFPVITRNGVDTIATLLIPVDPFRSYLVDVVNALADAGMQLPLLRPDLLIVQVRQSPGGTSVRLVPVEVKCRIGSIFAEVDIAPALDQAKNLAKVLIAMGDLGASEPAWNVGYRHLLLAMVDFAMRVYSQHPKVSADEGHWTSIHQSALGALLLPDPPVDVDRKGRLVIVDGSSESRLQDSDGDGFKEVIRIGTADAAEIVAGEPASFYEAVRQQVGAWGIEAPQTESLHQSAGEVTVGTAGAPAPDFDIVLTLGGGHDGGESDPIADLGSTGTHQPLSVQPEVGLPVKLHGEQRGVVVNVGYSSTGLMSRTVTLNISDTRLNQLNMGIVGDLGTGKTQLVKSLVHQISNAREQNRGVRPRFLIFDYKRDYSDQEFVTATGASVWEPRKLPVNLFDTSSVDATAPWLERYRFFADVLEKIYPGIGPVQRQHLKEAVRLAYQAAGASKFPMLKDVCHQYSTVLGGKVDSPLAIMSDLVDLEIFEDDPAKVVPFDRFLEGVVVISLDKLGQDDRSKNLVVAAMLNMFYENMLKQTKRPFVGSGTQLRFIDSFLLIDEADNIMKYNFDVLNRLLLQGREFGTGVILSSQYLSHFKVGGMDYKQPLLTWFLHKVPAITATELAAIGIASGAVDLADGIKSLPVHHCVYKSADVQGKMVRGMPFFELLQGSEGMDASH
jgi:hypothetical protein